MPAITFDQSERECSTAGRRAGGIVDSVAAENRKPIVFAQNAAATPTAAIAMPAIDGPTIRDRLNWAELSAIALPSIRGSTSDDMTAW